VIGTLSCTHKEIEWKGTIKEEDGVTVIKNSGKGLWGKEASEKITFKETLSLGNEEGDENYMFFGPIRLAVDDNLNIYVLDRKNYRLLKFDKDGNFIWKTGRQGQGPEEFQAPHDLALNPAGEIVILDSRSSIKFYGKNGSFLKLIKLNKTYWDLMYLPDGNLLLITVIEDQLGVGADYYSNELKFINEFPIEYRYGPKLPYLGGTSDRAISCFGDRVYHSLPDKYEIREYDLEGNMLRKVKRKINLTPFKLHKEKGVLKSITMRDISGPCFTYEDQIFINSICCFEEGAGRVENLDFFDSKRKYLGSYELPKNVYLSVVDSEDNFYFIQRSPVPRVSRCMLEIKSGSDRRGD